MERAQITNSQDKQQILNIFAGRDLSEEASAHHTQRFMGGCKRVIRDKSSKSDHSKLSIIILFIPPPTAACRFKRSLALVGNVSEILAGPGEARVSLVGRCS